MQARCDGDLAGRIERDANRIVAEYDGVAAPDELAGAVCRLLNERADAKAEIASLRASGHLLAAEVVVADHLGELLQGGLEAGIVVDEPGDGCIWVGIVR